MKKDNGITLISLVVTILILFILSSVTINVGTQTFDMVKVKSFVSKLKVIQAKVDNICEENTSISDYNFTTLEDISSTKQENYNLLCDIITNPEKYNIDISRSWNSTLDSDKSNYYYFEPKDLEKIGLKKQELTVIINFKTRNIITLNGISDEGKNYYRQYDLPGSEQLIEKY